MTPWKAAHPTDLVNAIYTPALVLDLDAFERNLQRMVEALKGHPVRLRAHAKSHKCPDIARPHGRALARREITANALQCSAIDCATRHYLY